MDFSDKSEPAQSELAWKRATILATSSIRTLKLARTCLNLAHKPITWASLTSIYIGSTWIDPYHQPNSHGLSTSDAFEVLRRCPNLTRCFLVFLPDGAPTPGNTPPTLVPDEKVSLPRLEFLGVHATILPNGFASSLSLPRLRTLSAFLTTGERQDRDANGLWNGSPVSGSNLQTSLSITPPSTILPFSTASIIFQTYAASGWPTYMGPTIRLTETRLLETYPRPSIRPLWPDSHPNSTAKVTSQLAALAQSSRGCGVGWDSSKEWKRR